MRTQTHLKDLEFLDHSLLYSLQLSYRLFQISSDDSVNNLNCARKLELMLKEYIIPTIADAHANGMRIRSSSLKKLAKAYRSNTREAHSSIAYKRSLITPLGDREALDRGNDMSEHTFDEVMKSISSLNIEIPSNEELQAGSSGEKGGIPSQNASLEYQSMSESHASTRSQSPSEL